MTIVKGTKQYPVRVIEDRPLARWFVLAMCIVVAVLAVFLSYHRGHAQGMEGQEALKHDVTRLEKDLTSETTRADELEQKLANINLGAEVDRKANEEVRQEVIALKEEIAALKEDNTFYRGLMAPTKNKQGLAFGAIELTKTRDRIYTFKVVMQQLATNHQLLNGYLQFVVAGRAEGVDVLYSLNDLSKDIDSDRVKLRFKYFQTIEGRLELPEGFDPTRIELTATSTGKNSVTVEKRFGWLAEEAL